MFDLLHLHVLRLLDGRDKTESGNVKVLKRT